MATEENKKNSNNIEDLKKALASIQETVDEIVDKQQQSLAVLTSQSESYDWYSIWVEEIRSKVSPIVDRYKAIEEAINDSIGHIMLQIREAISNTSFPGISEERKQELLSSYQTWGEYGWTIIPMADEALFDRKPADRNNANKTALRVCSKEAIGELFDQITDMRYCKKSDLAEAVFDYENKKYKSCALVLFGMIDAKLIRLQGRAKTGGSRKDWRDVGKAAIEKAKIRAEKNVKENMFLTMLFQMNFFSCLYTVFESGEDFKKQPKVINRNFLDHGMLTKPVRKKDCIQLFLLYYNLLKLLETIYQ